MIGVGEWNFVFFFYSFWLYVQEVEHLRVNKKVFKIPDRHEFDGKVYLFN